MSEPITLPARGRPLSASTGLRWCGRAALLLLLLLLLFAFGFTLAMPIGLLVRPGVVLATAGAGAVATAASCVPLAGGVAVVAPAAVFGTATVIVFCVLGAVPA